MFSISLYYPDTGNTQKWFLITEMCHPFKEENKRTQSLLTSDYKCKTHSQWWHTILRFYLMPLFNLSILEVYLSKWISPRSLWWCLLELDYLLLCHVNLNVLTSTYILSISLAWQHKDTCQVKLPLPLQMMHVAQTPPFPWIISHDTSGVP